MLTTKTSWLCLALVGALAACVDSGASLSTTESPLSALPQCRDRGFTPPARQSWRHWGSGLLALGGARHAARDVVVSSASGASLSARFTYGALNVGVGDENVSVYLDDCTGWRELGTVRTDGQGRITLPVGRALASGVYDLRFVVRGDASIAPATLWVLPRGTRLAVTDIDGTLTTSDLEQVLDMLFDGYVARDYDGAVELTQAHADLGHIVVYLSARPRELTAYSRDWLSDLGFADGPVNLADSLLLPVDASTGEYKRAFLAGLLAQGFVIDVAYGNATTDIYAYIRSGVGAARAWIIGSHAGEQGTNAAGADWTARAAAVAAMPPVQQPF